MKSPGDGVGDGVAEEVTSTTHGRRLELTLLVNETAANSGAHTEKDDSVRCHHLSGNGIKPECMS